MSPFQAADAAAFVRARLEAAADPLKAGPMASYMKTSDKFFGVQKPERERIRRDLKRRYPPPNRRGYEAVIRALWKQPEREARYMALEYASMWPDYVRSDSLALFEQLVRRGQWWDTVDFVAVGLVSPILRNERRVVRPRIERWIDDPNLWIRRTALLSQIKHKTDADERQLFEHCLRRAHESEFFIRKAIGWALRDYSWTRPDSARAFLLANREKLSPLSFREGAKQLVRSGRMKPT